jgi:hypothetical protein
MTRVASSGGSRVRDTHSLDGNFLVAPDALIVGRVPLAAQKTR